MADPTMGNCKLKWTPWFNIGYGSWFTEYLHAMIHSCGSFDLLSNTPNISKNMGPLLANKIDSSTQPKFSFGLFHIRKEVAPFVSSTWGSNTCHRVKALRRKKHLAAGCQGSNKSSHPGWHKTITTFLEATDLQMKKLTGMYAYLCCCLFIRTCSFVIWIEEGMLWDVIYVSGGTPNFYPPFQSNQKGCRSFANTVDPLAQMLDQKWVYHILPNWLMFLKLSEEQVSIGILIQGRVDFQSTNWLVDEISPPST